MLCFSLAELMGCFQPDEVPQHTGAGDLAFLWPQRGSVLSNEQHLNFELCRQVQVPSAGKLGVLEIRAAEWLFAQAQFSNLGTSMVIVWGTTSELFSSI